MPEARNGNVNAAVKDRAAGMYGYAQRSLDRVVPPDSRQHAYDRTAAFAADRPILFSFVVSQAVFSFLPIVLFATFAVSTVAFTLGAALLFALFWIGVAFMLLVPALILTSTVAVLVWGWAVGSFIVARWIYNHAPVAVKGDVRVDSGGKSLTVVKDERGIDGKVGDAN